MDDQKRGFTTSISTREMERRWGEVRKRMREEKLDLLVMQNGGYVKWLTDRRKGGGHAFTVIFPLDDEMTTISHGGKPLGDPGTSGRRMRGVKRSLTVPFAETLNYTRTYDAELAVEAIGRTRSCRIGIVGQGFMSAAFYGYLRENLPNAIFEDATDLVDQIQVIKSDEEISLIKEAAALQDEVMEYAKKVIRPGKWDFEIVADLIHKATYLGSQEQLVMGNSAPFGMPAALGKRQIQNRPLREGDQFTLLIEVDGPAGMYAELGRIFFLGKVPQELLEANELCKEAQEVTLKLLKPGADPGEIWRANNEFLVRKGFFPETRLYAHGQGHEKVERPAIRDDEPMKLKERMNIAVHPVAETDRIWVWLCDNYLITGSGISGCLHKIPKEIIPL